MADKYNRELIQVIEANSADWLEQVPAVLGDLEGNVDAGGSLVYARLDNGIVIIALNYMAPLIFDLHVLVGRNKAQDGFFQVISVRETYNNPVSGFVKYHHEQHEFDVDGRPGPDQVWVDRKAILPLTIIVSDAANFKVEVFGAVAQTATGIQLIPSQEKDLSSYIPTAGAKYVSFEVDDDGVISIHDGDVVGSAELLTEANIPVPGPGKYFLGYAILYELQAELSNENIRVAFPLGVVATGVGYQIDTAPADTPEELDKWGFWDVTDEELKSITHEDFLLVLTEIFDLLYAEIVHSHTATDVDFPVGHLHGLARWNGSSGQTTFELPDYWEYIESVIINGVSEDPAGYSLSTDGDQIVLDTALPGALPVWVNGVIKQI